MRVVSGATVQARVRWIVQHIGLGYSTSPLLSTESTQDTGGSNAISQYLRIYKHPCLLAELDYLHQPRLKENPRTLSDTLSKSCYLLASIYETLSPIDSTRAS